MTSISPRHRDGCSETSLSVRKNPEIEIEYCGRLPYREAWKMQRERFEALIAEPESGEERIFVVEHPPVYTLGFHGNAANMLASEERLLRMGAECIRIERGGDITYHGPGQCVVYPILNLRRHRLGVKQYVELLEDSVIETLGLYGIKGTRNSDEIGIWIDRDTPGARKICAIGVKISHGITMHGLALNVNTDMNMFGLINPCGILDKGVTSMALELGAEQDFGEVSRRLAGILKKKIEENDLNHER